MLPAGGELGFLVLFSQFFIGWILSVEEKQRCKNGIVYIL